MTKNTNLILKRVLGILLSVSIIIAGICLIVGCLTIYYSGDHPYSRGSVAEVFSKIAIPVYICLALTIISFIVEFLFPSNETKGKIRKNYSHILSRLNNKKDVEKCDDEVITAIMSERKKRKLHTAIRTVLIILGCAVFLVYAVDPGNYHKDINTSVIGAMWVLIPCLAVPFAYSVFTVYYTEKSLRKEIELLKQAPNKDVITTETRNDSENTALTVRLVLLAVGIAILIYGFITNGTADVLTKAINICTECIGLG